MTAALELKPHWYARFYVVVATALALLFLLLYPSVLAPHESQHFLRGLTFSTLYDDGTLPESIFTFLDTAPTKTAAAIPLDDATRRAFTPHSNVSIYPAMDYLPQIAAGSMGELASLKPAQIYYLARALCLLCGVLVGYAVLRLLPAFHLPVLVGLLLPSAWIMQTSQYPDYMANLSAFVFFALILRALYGNSLVTPKKLLVFCGVALVLSASKMLYFPLAFCFLLIPAKCFASTRWRAVCVAAVLACSALPAAGLMSAALHQEYDMQLEDIFTSPAAQAPAQNNRIPYKQYAVQMLMSEPLATMQQVFATYSNRDHNRQLLYKIFVWGGDVKQRVHNPEALLGTIGTLPLLLALAPFFMALGGTGSPVAAQPYEISPLGRLLLLGVITGIAILIALAMYTGWQGNVGRSVIGGIQGRYFIPLLPYVALMCSIYLPYAQHWRWLRRQALLSLVVLVLCYLYLFAVL